jgi:hypothetical protein
MPIGISQRGLIGGHADSEVNQFAQTTGKPVADLARRVGVRQLTEQHPNQLRSATEALGRPLGIVFLHQPCELQIGEMQE